MKQKLKRTKYNRVLFSHDLHKSILGREGDCVRGGGDNGESVASPNHPLTF